MSYSCLVRLINRIFNLHSNFIIKTKYNLVITDDFDLDGYILHQIPKHSLEFIVEQYNTNDWHEIKDDIDDNFEFIEIENNYILVTTKPIYRQQKTFLQKATKILHGSTNLFSNNCLTKQEFFQMFDSSNGRLLNEQLFRQRIYDNGCEQSIRQIVWLYLFRIFNQAMTNQDKIQYVMKSTKRYKKYV